MFPRQKRWMGEGMPYVVKYRRKAEECGHLAVGCRDCALRELLLNLRREYLAAAEEIELSRRQSSGEAAAMQGPR
jgi:hypothetical protein